MKLIPSLISDRYQDDRRSLENLTPFSEAIIETFLSDKDIQYEYLETCPLCHHDKGFEVAKKDRFGIPIVTVVCEQCGLIFSLNQMTHDSTERFYSKYYRDMYECEQSRSRENWAERFELGAKKKIPKYIPKTGVVIEIGCGGGWNLLRFKKTRLDYYGFDYDTESIDFGRREFGLKLFSGGVAEAIEKGLCADYVFLDQVLEHTKDPVFFLKEVTQLLRDEKSVLNLSVPCADYLRFSGGATGHDLLSTLQNAHNFLFDEFTLRLCVLKASFSPYNILGGNALVRYRGGEEDTVSLIFDSLKTNFRGHEVIKKLKSCEGSHKLKTSFFQCLPRKIRLNAHLLYFMTKPKAFLHKVLIGYGLL